MERHDHNALAEVESLSYPAQELIDGLRELHALPLASHKAGAVFRGGGAPEHSGQTQDVTLPLIGARWSDL